MDPLSGEALDLSICLYRIVNTLHTLLCDHNLHRIASHVVYQDVQTDQPSLGIFLTSLIDASQARHLPSYALTVGWQVQSTTRLEACSATWSAQIDPLAPSSQSHTGSHLQIVV